MALYTAELRWGPAGAVWTGDPQIRMTCRDLAQVDDSLAHLLSFVPAGELAVLQIVADTEFGTFTLAEFTGEPGTLEQHYRRGRCRGFTAGSVTARTEDRGAATRAGADSAPA